VIPTYSSSGLIPLGCISKCFIEFSIREQARIRSDDGAANLHHDATIEIEPKNAVFGFTRRVRHFGTTSSA
jgi:hypothetical protein